MSKEKKVVSIRMSDNPKYSAAERAVFKAMDLYIELKEKGEGTEEFNPWEATHDLFYNLALVHLSFSKRHEQTAQVMAVILRGIAEASDMALECADFEKENDESI